MKRTPLEQKIMSTAERYLGLLETKMNKLETDIMKEPNERRKDTLNEYKKKLEDIIAKTKELQERPDIKGTKELYTLEQEGNQILKNIQAEKERGLPLTPIEGGGQPAPKESIEEGQERKTA